MNKNQKACVFLSVIAACASLTFLAINVYGSFLLKNTQSKLTPTSDAIFLLMNGSKEIMEANAIYAFVSMVIQIFVLGSLLKLWRQRNSRIQ